MSEQWAATCPARATAAVSHLGIVNCKEQTL
jgi:hypothetical protein